MPYGTFPPSERCVRLSPHTAQASQRLLTEPGRTSLPARYSLAASTSRLIHYARQSLRSGRIDRYFSRDETPDGSQPAFAEDDTVPICFITKQPSLAPSSFTRHPIGLPYGSLSLPGERRVYHVPPLYPHGLGLASTPGVLHLRPVTLEHRFLTPYLLVQASQHFPLVSHHDGCRPFTCVDLPMPSSLPTTSVLVVATSAHALVTTLADEATWSQQLRTPPLPVTHVLVGYCWQNNR